MRLHAVALAGLLALAACAASGDYAGVPYSETPSGAMFNASMRLLQQQWAAPAGPVPSALPMQTHCMRFGYTLSCNSF
jgi:hypothetical protein